MINAGMAELVDAISRQTEPDSSNRADAQIFWVAVQVRVLLPAPELTYRSY